MESNVFLNHQEAVFLLKLFIKHTCLSGKYFAGKIFVTNQRSKQLLMISKNVNFPGIILRIVTFPGIFCEISGFPLTNTCRWQPLYSQLQLSESLYNMKYY